MSSDLYHAARIAVCDCMGLQAGEKALVVTDEPLRKIGYSLWEVIRDLGNEVLLVEMLPRSSNGAEPPPDVAALMKRADVVLCPTSKSLTHTGARRAATEQGSRVATLPGVTEEIMVRCMNADYARIERRTLGICALLNNVRSIHVTAPAGTDIEMPVQGRTALASTGIFRSKGQWGNLPTGEAYLAPLEGKSNGIVVVDGSMAMIGVVKEPIRIDVEDGYAIGISGGADAEALSTILQPHGKDARNVAEFGIGTNDRAILSGRILEDEKVMGTIHIAFGDNKSMGGNIGVASHLDGLVQRPTVWFDDREIMRDGKFVVEI